MKFNLVKAVSVAIVLAAVVLAAPSAEAKTKMVSSAASASSVDAALAHKHLVDGWNKVALLRNGDILWVDYSGGKVGEWQVRAKDGTYLKTWLRPDGDNIRIWWAPQHGPGLFVTGSAAVIAP